MTFIYDNNNVVSFAEFEDILDADSRLFAENEGLSDSIIYPYLVKSTERIINKIQMTDWWKSLKLSVFDPNLIIAKQDYFTDLTVYYAFAEFILPYIADFGNQDTAEFQKMQYYQNKFNQLFDELLTSADWYDIDENNTIDPTEVIPSVFNRRRVR